MPATHRRVHGIRYFRGCYSLGDDQLWGVMRARKGGHHSLAAHARCYANLGARPPSFCTAYRGVQDPQHRNIITAANGPTVFAIIGTPT